MDAVAIFSDLNNSYGINLSIFHDDFDRNLFLEGIRYTAWLSIASIIGSMLLGAVGAYVQYTGSGFAKRFVNGYVHVFRNTPPLVQLYFFYFALGPTLREIFPGQLSDISNVTWAIISLSLYAGAFAVEIFRAGIEAVPKSTIEAADALGMTEAQIFRKIILPLAVRISLTGLTNNLVNLIKTSTNAYAIAVPEVLYASSQIWSDQLNTLEMMLILLTFFIVIVGVFTWLMGLLERVTAVPGWGKA